MPDKKLTPREKYLHDPKYRRLVDNFAHLMTRPGYDPIEVLEACTMAAIGYHELYGGGTNTTNSTIEEELFFNGERGSS